MIRRAHLQPSLLITLGALAALAPFAMLVMGLAPLIAPKLGSLVLLVGSWRWVFATLLGITLITALLFLRAVPEVFGPPFGANFPL